MPVRISIAVCTYRRPDVLGEALLSLCRQNLPHDQFEILLVDNDPQGAAPAPAVAQILADTRQAYPLHNIRYLPETRLGLGIARNLAVKHASGSYLGYMDDDARAAPDWLEKALPLLEQADQPDCVGGPIYPFYTTPRPAWFKDCYESRSWGEKMRGLQAGESFSGSNMIWRVDILEQLGGFGEGVGVRGETLSVGEETAAFKKLWQFKSIPRLLYSPDLIVYHWAPSFKMRPGYYLKRAFAAGQADVKLRTQLRPQAGLASRLLTTVRSSVSAVLHLGLAVLRRWRYPYWQNWAIEELQPVLARLGTALAAAGLYLNIKQK